ncbi:MAG TPA: carboxypeptidase regulatory-like domain-containing protein, partial [Pyrinomonadaceae bacterium]
AIPAKYVSRAVIDPNNQNTAYVTLSGYFGNTTTARVYKTTNLSDAAPTWTGLGAGQIPDVPANAFAVDPADSNTLYLGTDIGVYRSVDGGANWAPFSTGLPRVAVFDMAVHNAARKLRIATHGRGMWEISIAANPAILQGTVTDALTHAPVENATVTAGANSTATDENGFYQFQSIPAGTYSLTVAAVGYLNGAAANVTAANGSATTQNFALTSAPSAACPSDTNQSDFMTGLAANVDVTSSPGDAKLSLLPSAVEEQTTLEFFSNSFTTTVWQAQTFTPSATGRLNQVDFQAALSSATSTLGTVVVEIRNSASGVPGSTVLASANLTTINSTGNAWYTVNFAAPPSVNAGTQYAIVLRAATGGPYRGVRTSTDAYAGGSWLQSSNSGGSWSQLVSGTATLDLAFRAYVVSTNYQATGNYVSAPKDANQADGTQAGWDKITWTAATPAGTDVKFQAAAGNLAGGLFTFVGPDGTPNTYFSNGASLAQFNGFRYLKYKAYLSTTNTAVTPTLGDVTVCNSNTPLPATSLNIAPATGTYGATTTLTATLTSGGSPLAGKPVTFKLNGANFAGNTATTDASGVATISNVSLSGLNAGTYANYVSAKFASDASYAGTSGSNSLTVEKATPTINWANPA